MTLSWDCIKPCLGFLDRDKDGDVDLQDLILFKDEITELASNIKQAVKETAQLIKSSKLVENNEEATAQIDIALEYLNKFDKRIDKVQQFADSATEISKKLPIEKIRIKFQEAQTANTKIRPGKDNKNNLPKISFAELTKLASTLEEIEKLMGLDNQPAPKRTNSAPWHI